jgi:Arm DNA-binding domain
MRTKITLRAVAKMPPNCILWDGVIAGFNCRRQFSETRTYSIIYRTKDQVQRWHKIGHHGVFTPELARKQARHILLAVATGQDPSDERHQLRDAMSFCQLCDDYSNDMQSGKINGKKASSLVMLSKSSGSLCLTFSVWGVIRDLDDFLFEDRQPVVDRVFVERGEFWTLTQPLCHAAHRREMFIGTDIDEKLAGTDALADFNGNGLGEWKSSLAA